eukprot:970921_1
MDVDVCCFPKLKSIETVAPNMKSLLKIIINAPYLEHFGCEIPCFPNEKQTITIIDALFRKCIHLREVSLHLHHHSLLGICTVALHYVNKKIQTQLTFSGGGKMHMVIHFENVRFLF